jgi:hypothetical protein
MLDPNFYLIAAKPGQRADRGDDLPPRHLHLAALRKAYTTTS